MNIKTKNNRSKFSALYEISKVITSTLEPKEVLNHIIEAAVKITKATSGSLLLIDRESEFLNIEVTRGQAYVNAGNVRLKVGEGITGWVAKTGKPLLVPDVRKDRRYVMIDKEIRSELAVPLILEGEVIGVVNVNSTKLSAFTQEDLRLLSTLAGQSAQVIKNAKLYDAVRRKANELSALFNVSKIITKTLNLEEVLRQVVEQAASLMNTKVCSLMLLNEEGTELVIKAVQGGSPDYVNKPNLKVNESLIGTVVKTKKPLVSIDVLKEKGYKYLDLARREGLCSLLSVPLILKGKIIGVINTYKSTRHKFTAEEIALLSGLADQAAIAIENARLYESMINLEEQIRRMEKLGVLGELSVEMAHEIRNPLTVIKMLIHALEVNDRRDLAIIENELDRMNGIVSRFLDYARPVEPKLERIEINQILEDVLLLVNHRMERQKIKVEKDLSTIPVLCADGEKMKQVFLNLFLNAIDAMPKGGRLGILIRKAGRRYMRISISDTGMGIPPSLRDKIFLPFVTTKENGLGLGLPIVRRLVEQHKGRIEVESQDGWGTTFNIFLPIGEEEESEVHIDRR